MADPQVILLLGLFCGIRDLGLLGSVGLVVLVGFRAYRV